MIFACDYIDRAKPQSLYFPDIDECLDKNGGCTTYCNNTDGGYHCLCDPGYRLSWDDKTCESILDYFFWLELYLKRT